MTALPIGELARQTGVKVPTIRYYESIGILPKPPRSKSNRRLYGLVAVRRLRFVRHARELGFEIDAIRTLLALQSDPDQSCAEVDRIARSHLGEVERRIKSLRALRNELKHMIESCARGRVGQCRVIEALADHVECRASPHQGAARLK